MIYKLKYAMYRIYVWRLIMESSSTHENIRPSLHHLFLLAMKSYRFLFTLRDNLYNFKHSFILLLLFSKGTVEALSFVT